MSEFKVKFNHKKNKFTGGTKEVASEINDKTDRNEKQMNLAYWANVNYMASSQIILQAQESLPEIYSIKRIYMIVVMGRMVMQLDDHVEKIYSPGDVIDVPIKTMMKIKSISSEKTAILVMKS